MGLLQFIGAVFSRLRRNKSTSSKTESLDPRHRLGARGEKLAARHLRRNGYKILYRNFRPPHGGEVDIVCRHRDTLVFVEVKTRSSTKFGSPLEAVSRDKQELIIRGALAWLKLLGNPRILIRFDIIEVYSKPDGEEIHQVENAFTLPPAMNV